MVFFTVFATIDSLTLLVAMTGLLLSSAFSLKSLADLEHAAWKSLTAKSGGTKPLHLDWICMFQSCLLFVPQEIVHPLAALCSPRTWSIRWTSSIVTTSRTSHSGSKSDCDAAGASLTSVSPTPPNYSIYSSVRMYHSFAGLQPHRSVLSLSGRVANLL